MMAGLVSTKKMYSVHIVRYYICRSGGSCRSRPCRRRGRIRDRTDFDSRRRPDPMNSTPSPQPGDVVHASIQATDRFCRDVFAAIGADEATADAATRAMMHGSRHGVDSHGVRLLDHYVEVMNGGRANRKPNIRVVQSFGAVASLDTKNGRDRKSTRRNSS